MEHLFNVIHVRHAHYQKHQIILLLPRDMKYT